MFKSKRTAQVGALLAGVALAATACSSTGGAKAQNSQAAAAGSGGHANTPKITIAMITHQAPGDTFWDIIRKGAIAASQKDNVNFRYSSDPTSTNEANLVQDAIDSHVDGIAVTLPDPSAIGPAVKKAVAAGIPVVAFNAGRDSWKQYGALEYFGQDESTAGLAAGKRAASDGFKHVLCVVQEQGQVQLEARCSGVQKGFTGKYTKLYVNGRDAPSVTTTIQAQLKQDPSIDLVITLGAPIALDALQSLQSANSKAKVATFDFNSQIPAKIKNGQIQWAIDQQPYLQGYEAIDSLWLYKENADVLGGGDAVGTGPYFIDKSNIQQIAKYAERGTR